MSDDQFLGIFVALVLISIVSAFLAAVAVTILPKLWRKR